METTYVEMSAMELRAENGRHFIEGICVPYGAVTTRVGPVPEVFERGAFRDLVGVGDRKVKLTDYNHSRNRVPVGYAATFEDRSAGLWARFRLNNTPEGESARMNADDGVYGGLSVGFVAKSEEMRDGVRHVTHAWLDHVSLVEEPAYEDARILQVRQAADWRAEFEQLRDRSILQLGIDAAPRPRFTVLVSRMRNR